VENFNSMFFSWNEKWALAGSYEVTSSGALVEALTGALEGSKVVYYQGLL
jgi:hypothetical protein